MVVYNNRYIASLGRQETRLRLGDTPAVLGEARTWIMSPYSIPCPSFPFSRFVCSEEHSVVCSSNYIVFRGNFMLAVMKLQYNAPQNFVQNWKN